MLDEYQLKVVKHGIKLSRHGRASGGILVFVKKYVSEYFRYIDDFDCGVILQVHNNIFDVPVLYVVCYIPPSGSSFYNQLHFNCNVNGIALLDDKICQLKIEYPNYDLILSGDFNARTKNLQDDSTYYLPDFYPEVPY